MRLVVLLLEKNEEKIFLVVNGAESNNACAWESSED